MKKIIDIKAFLCTDDINLDYKEAIKFLNQNSLDIYINKSYIFEVSNNLINLYLTDSEYSSKILVFSIDENKNIIISDIAKEKSLEETEELIKSLVTAFESVSSYIMFISDGFNINTPKSNKHFKCIKGKDNTVKVKDKANNIEFKIISLLDDKSYNVIKEGTAFKIINNDFSQNLITVPSKNYPLANKKEEIRIFDNTNTEVLNDDLNEVLSKINIRHGFCFENSREIYTVLKPIYGERIKYYSGWLRKKLTTAFHAWIVIDDKSIIDSTILYKVEELERNSASSGLKGEDFISRDEQMDIVKRAISQSIPFSEKYRCGKVSELDIYIGVESSYDESYDCYKRILSNASNHPDLNGLDDLGRNNTLRELGCY